MSPSGPPDAAALPAPDPPFPVDPPKRIEVDVAPLGGPVFLLDARAAEYAEHVLGALERSPERYRAFASWREPEALNHALLAAAERAARDVPRAVRHAESALELPLWGIALRDPAGRAEIDELAAPHPDFAPLRRRALELLAARPPADRLADALRLALQEDLVMMRADPERGAVGAEWLAVAMPSAWDPGAHGGSDLHALHGPVPHGDRLRGASANLLKAMVAKGPFVRHVWALPFGPTLDRHPRVPRDEPGPGPLLPQTWLRTERQTTWPLPELGRALFAIRIHQTPLREVLGDPATPRGAERRARLADAVASLSDALAAYKGLTETRERLVGELRAEATPR